MSKIEDNLELAQKVRGSGYKTKVHALPEFKMWFDGEYRSGRKSIKALREEGMMLFPRLAVHIPSVTRLKSYADNYLSETVKISPYTPNYILQMEKFDSYLKMHALAKELLSRYEQAKKREQLLNRPDGSFEWATLYGKHLMGMLDIELKLGLRPFVASNTMYVQQNNFVQVSNPIASEEPRDVSDEEIEKLTIQLRKYQSSNV